MSGGIMRIWIVIFWISLVTTFAKPYMPLNYQKGDGIFYEPSVDNDSYLKLMKNQNMNFLFHQCGEIRYDFKDGLKAALTKVSIEEHYWEKLNPFSNYMVIKLDASALDAVTQKPSALNEISQTILQHLKVYDLRFDGVLLNLDYYKSNYNLNLQAMVSEFQRRNYKLGIQMNLESIGTKSFEKWLPHFFVFHIVPQIPGTKINMKNQLRIAARLAKPFYLSVGFGELALDNINLNYYPSNISEHLSANELVLMDEYSDRGHLWRKYKAQSSFKLDQEHAVTAGDLLQTVEPSIQIIDKVQKLASQIPSFYFSGVVYDLKRVHPRYLLTKWSKDVRPELFYQLDQNDNDWLLRVRMSNESLLSSSRGNDAVGVGISTRGFQLLSVDVGEFENVKIQNSNRDVNYLFSISELQALKSSSEVTLRLKPTAKSAIDAKIMATAWMRPFGSKENQFHQGKSADLTPVAGLRTFGTPIYETASTDQQSTF